MANQVLTNAGLWVSSYDLSGDANACALGMSADLLDDTALADGSRSRSGGLQRVAFSADGYWTDAGDGTLQGTVGFSNVPVSIAPAGLTAGSTVFFFRATVGDYKGLSGSVGDMLKFNVGAETSGLPLVRGALLGNVSAAAASANGSSVTLGAVSATQSVYAALHVISATGTTPTLAVKVQSAAASNFASPTDRITFSTTSGTTASGATNFAQFASAAGAITDTYWRIAYTITGTNPAFSFVVAAGIR